MKGLLCRAAVIVSSLLACSCQLMKEDYDDETASCDPAQYINVTIAVRSDQTPVTRSRPQGGEDGDGREKGIDPRENLVEGVTLVFYRNAAGINAAAESAAATTIDYVAYYTTTLATDYSPRAGHYPGEVYYTTGDQAMPVALERDQTYHMLVIANANLTSQITTASTLSTVRDMVYSGALYTGNEGDASKFVMTSSDDNVLTFNNYKETPSLNRITYLFDNIHIERMAARIDFWADGSTAYSNGSGTDSNFDKEGYVYDVGTNNHFVLTSVEPFNLNGGNEYLFKRTNDANPYLANETLLNWVVDCNAGKTAATFPSYITSNIETVAAKTDNLSVTTAGVQSRKFTVEGKDNFIVAYPKENTILAATPYYYYATGLAFEGYYYANGATTGGERRVYYHFIRHQGESEGSYTALSADDLTTTDKTATIGDAGTPMNLGIVRNNIYRISIENISPLGGRLTFRVAEHDWRMVNHPQITM